jgi:hypothetical protein
MKKVLFVSLAFPPKADPEGLQTAKYFHHLQKHKDLQIDVVTSAIPTLYMPYDQDLEPYAKGVNQLVSIPLKENRYINYFLHRVGLQNMVFPDVKYRFHRQFRSAVNQLKQKPDVIYSRADPKSSTVMAYKLKQVLKVPWILHMSDPWADCPMKRMTGSDYETHNSWERKCLEQADIISLTSQPTIEFYKKKYPALEEKFRFYPNVFEDVIDENVGVDLISSNDRKLRIVYTGGLADERTPKLLLKPLKEIFTEHPLLASKLEVIFAGDVDSRNRAIFQTYNLPFVKWIGKVPYQEALRLQKSADYLVVIDNPIDDPSMSMFFPSKLLDYMVARKRILAITTKGSASDQVMQDLKGDVCHHNEPESVKSAIMRTLDAFKNKDSHYLTNGHPPEKYKACYNADRLYNEIITLLDV